MTTEDLLNEIQVVLAMRNKTPQLLDVKEAAKYLAVSERTIRRWIEFQKIPVFRHDDIVRIDCDEIRKFVKANTQPVNEIWRSQPLKVRARRKGSDHHA